MQHQCLKSVSTRGIFTIYAKKKKNGYSARILIIVRMYFINHKFLGLTNWSSLASSWDFYGGVRLILDPLLRGTFCSDEIWKVGAEKYMVP